MQLKGFHTICDACDGISFQIQDVLRAFLHVTQECDSVVLQEFNKTFRHSSVWEE